MNFFRSILSEDSDPPTPEKPHDSEHDSDSLPGRSQDPDDVGQKTDQSSPLLKSPNSIQFTDGSIAAAGGGGGAWSFGGLIKTLATQSESVLETYKRDLREFGSGLRKETDIIREVASRAVKDLPASLEAGASVAHGSLESVGQALDGVLKSTADIISQGKEGVNASSDGESETPDANRSLSSRRYSRFEAQLNTIQTDVNTFSKNPEDLEEYMKWKLEFKLEEMSTEVEELTAENGILDSLYKRLVPSTVEHDTFWCRYFYKVHKLKQQESVRANLVKRAISVDDEEELSWDVDDEDDDDDDNGWEQKSNVKAHEAEESRNEVSIDESLTHVKKQGGSSNELQNKDHGKSTIVDNVDKNDAADPSKTGSNNVPLSEKVKSEEITEPKDDEKVESEEIAEEKTDKKEVKSDEKVPLETNDEKNDASKESAVSDHQSAAQEDLEWDEIEDIESHDEKKVSTTHGGSPNRAELRNRLSIAEEDEDLSWDIEDDDEPLKA